MVYLWDFLFRVAKRIEFMYFVLIVNFRQRQCVTDETEILEKFASLSEEIYLVEELNAFINNNSTWNLFYIRNARII